MQLHPSDTGGSFLEIDWCGGGPPGGPWWPAGSSWEPAVRTDVVAGIRGVEVQAADPAAVARRWSEIVEIDLEVDGLALPLDGATIRFVPDEDGRGDGLAGCVVDDVDWDLAVLAAGERGLPVAGGAITIAGTRFRALSACG
jgi:hypothetical protein